MSSTDAVETNPEIHTLRTFLITLLLAAAAALLLVLALVFGAARLYDGKILPGVRVGSVDLSGLTVDQAREKLVAAYADLGDGVVKVDTPSGEALIKFSEIGRSADAAAMADRAYGVGRTGDPMSQAVETAMTITKGMDVPLAVKLDTSALAARLRALSITNGLDPKNAEVDASAIPFGIVPSVLGRGLDENVIGSQIVQRLSIADAPREFSVSGTYVELEPQIADGQARIAADLAEKMVGDVTLGLNGKTYTLPAATVRQSLDFAVRPDGSFGPVVDLATIKTFLSGIATKVAVPAQDPTFLVSKGGTPIGVTAGKNGLELDVDATADAIVKYIESRGAGSSDPSVALVTKIVAPKMSDSQMAGILPEMTRLGAWTVRFYPGIANCNGKNIRTPAAHINGSVVAPGAIFSFWDGVGPVDVAHGFCAGGVIKNGKSDYTGAMGGGICSASTTMFNAALRAGVEIIERHNHFYWIDRYPAGLDATVYWDGAQKLDMRWRNDTAYPILVIGKSTTSSVTFELWSVKTGRTVNIPSKIVKRDIVHATWKTVYVTTLAPGVKHVVEGAYDGFKITRTRTVKDASGKIIHNDVFYTHYGKVDGIIEVGISKTPAPTPAPTSAFLLLPFLLATARGARRLRGRRR